jgi:hypothetical protein
MEEYKNEFICKMEELENEVKKIDLYKIREESRALAGIGGTLM